MDVHTQSERRVVVVVVVVPVALAVAVADQDHSGHALSRLSRDCGFHRPLCPLCSLSSLCKIYHSTGDPFSGSRVRSF